MIWQLAKVLLAALVISFTSWLAGRQPRLAGFLLALPIASMLAIAFSQLEFSDPARSVVFAKSVFFAVPLSLLFFVPFLLAGKLRMHFWGLYGSGVALTALGYGVHRYLVR